MSSFAQNVRGTLERSFVALPLLLLTWALFLGSTTGNIGLIVLGMGHATVVPLTTMILHTIERWLQDIGFDWFSMPASATCNLLPSGFTNAGARDIAAPTYWLAHILFFFTFLITNATEVLNMPAAANAPADKVERRKSQAQFVQIMAIVFLLVILGIRFGVMGCERMSGLFIGGLVFGTLGYSWYRLARECSARDSDIFGIVQGILPPGASDPPPMTCVYTK